MTAKVFAVVGDITEQDVDAVVNAANPYLANGSGVCGAIFEAAGVQEMEGFIRKIKRTTGIEAIPEGQSVVTPGGKLKAKWVIHSVGPRYGWRRDLGRESGSARGRGEGFRAKAGPCGRGPGGR